MDASARSRHLRQATVGQPRGDQHQFGLHRGGLPTAAKLHRPGPRIGGPQLGHRLGHQGGTGGYGGRHQPLIQGQAREHPPGRQVQLRPRPLQAQLHRPQGAGAQLIEQGSLAGLRQGRQGLATEAGAADLPAGEAAPLDQQHGHPLAG